MHNFLRWVYPELLLIDFFPVRAAPSVSVCALMSRIEVLVASGSCRVRGCFPLISLPGCLTECCLETSTAPSLYTPCELWVNFGLSFQLPTLEHEHCTFVQRHAKWDINLLVILGTCELVKTQMHPVERNWTSSGESDVMAPVGLSWPRLDL